MALFLLYSERFQMKMAILLLASLFHAVILGLKRKIKGQDGNHFADYD